MLQAVKTYRGSGQMSFLGWWEMYLKTAYNRALGVRWEKTLHDPMHQCISLSAPLGMDDGGTLAEVVPDKRDMIAAVEAEVWREELRAAVDTALESVPNDWRILIEGRYLYGKTLKELAAEMGSSPQAISEKTTRALKRL